MARTNLITKITIRVGKDRKTSTKIVDKVDKINRKSNKDKLIKKV
jgi:hypothetical protein